MAIDTAEDRRSVAGVSVGWGITPNTLKDAEWRQQVAWNYSGIALAEEEEDVPGCVHIESEVVTNILITSRNVYYVGVSDQPATEVQITSETC